MTQENKKNQILNLCEKAPDSLLAFFQGLNAEVITRDNASDYANLDFILVDSEDEAKLAEKDFSCAANEIAVVCLGQVKEMRNFLLGNGRLTIDPDFLESKLGEAILTKFFTGQHNIHLDESFSGQFPDVETIKVTNHLALGESLDELSLQAFERDFNLVALRSFLDHALIYFTYLKQAGLAGIPFEIEYSSNDEFFAVNIHAPVKNFTAEYLLDSFGSVNSKDPIQYLLGVTARSSDFMDITHVEKPGRVVLSGFWGKSTKRKLSGLSFNNIKTTAQLTAQLEKKIKSFRPAEELSQGAQEKAGELKTKSLPGGILALALAEHQDSIVGTEPEKASNIIAFAIGRFEEIYPDESINDMGEDDLQKILGEHPDQELVESLSDSDRQDLLDKIQKKNITDAYNEEIKRARAGLKEDEDFREDLSNTFTEEVVKRVSGHLDADVLNRIMDGGEEEELLRKVAGKKELDDFKQVVKGVKDKPDFAQKISGNFESKAGDFKVVVSGSGDNPRQGIFDFVTSALGGLDDMDMDSNAKSFFMKTAPTKIASGLERHAQRLGLDISSLDEEHLLEFKNTMLPSIIQDVLSDEFSIEEYVRSLEAPIDRANQLLDSASPEFREKFREKLRIRLDEFEGLDQVDGKYIFTDTSVEKDDAQQIIQDVMRQALDEEFHFAEGSKEEIEAKEKAVIQEFSKTLNKGTDEVAEIVKGASEMVKGKETQKVVETLFKEKPGDKEDVVVKEFQGEQVQNENSAEKNAKDNAAAKEEAKEATNMAETHLLQRIKVAEEENKKLKDALKAMEVKAEAAKTGNETLAKIDKKAKEEIAKDAAKEKEGRTEKGEFEKVVEEYEKAAREVDKEAVKKLKEGDKIDHEQAKKIAEVLDREQKLLTAAKDAQSNLKTLEVELKKKESLFLSEINKANKVIKAKEAIVEKVKGSVENMLTKKQAEVADYKKKVEELNHRLKDDKAAKFFQEIKTLKKENESVAKVAEMYKSKVENMLKKKQRSNESSQSEQLASENRTLSRMNVQLENKLNSEMKEKKSIESQFIKLKAQEGKLRARATGAEGKFKKAQDEIEKLKANEARLVKLANKAAEGGAGGGKSSKEVETLKATNIQLQATLKEMAEKLKAGGGAQQAAAPGAGSTKEKQLEQKVKNLNSELSKAKNEVGEAKKQMMKMKNEATALKNKIKQLEKAQAGKKKAA